jgi:arylformamidase
MKTTSRSSTSRLDRRSFLTAAAGAVVAAGTAVAQQSAPPASPPRTKGPLVWLDMDQKELDDAYTQSVYAPNQQHVARRNAAKNQEALKRLAPPRRFAYGPSPIERLDVYLTNRPNAPVSIFVHGGAWRGGSASECAFQAEVLVRAGAHFVALDFINVLEANGNLMTMADQVRRAVAWVYRNAPTFGGDPGRLYVSGHSSGGHLAGVILTTDWPNDFNLPPDIIKGGLCASGMFDLKPVRLSVRSTYVKFTDEMEEALSPQRRLDKLRSPLIVAYGTLETPEFQRQSRDFAAAAKAAGKDVQLLVGEGYNHFEIRETFGNPYGFLGRALLEQIKLATA